jgi:pimeloyl-ACP methyl ester carboxylesterase
VPSKSNETPIVFVHGFKGSRIIDDAGREDWLTGSIALGLRSPQLALPIEFKNGRQADDGRRAAGPLGKVVVVPKLLESPVYQPWLQTLERSGRPWYAFAYDWRRDNGESAERLADFVTDLRKKHGGRPVQMVAHSNGGLVTLAALHDGLPGIERILFAGVPFAGGVGFLEDMHLGTKTGLNGRVLAPPVLATFSSVYAFYPLKEAALTDEQGALLGIDLLDPGSWKTYRLGIYGRGEVPPEFDAFLGEALSRAKSFRQRLLATRKKYPPIDVLVGVGRPTLTAIARKAGATPIEWDVAGGRRADGDGRVCAAHALPPDGIPFTRYETTREHAEVLADPIAAELLAAGASPVAAAAREQ